MSAQQRPLFDPGPADGALTDRQRRVYDAISREGLTDLEAGELLGVAPAWRDSAGREVLTALRKKGLVVRRRTGFWHRVRPVEPPLYNEFPDGF